MAGHRIRTGMPNGRLSRDGREDARLVEKCRRGDELAFEALVLKYQNQVYGVAYRMVGDSEEAMDLAQETFIKAYRGLDTYKPAMPFRTWLLRIGTNSAIDNLRKRGRGRDMPVELGSKPRPGAINSSEVSWASFDPPGPETDIPENVSVSNETAGIISEALSELPDNYRAVVILHHMEGMSYSEIGKALGVPRNTAKTWGHRARGLLCGALEGVM
ncbi:MAG: RNA polymerase sigma factor SigW [Candidatus Anoxymicrobium japonicum]|uniref:RNA polymerase sigma factor SigW n=1 Tax=Candidatus Anoxymicrobium japonicum TaxID=2013648 RepID=A0A2N3G6P5_9ACTN|nr:MAG: RNA polymerase sigma factor SigW [Candidatus Anoxymicrobium japonicum]